MTVAVLVLAYLAITLTAAIRTEEAHLTEKFGAAYPDYRDGRRAAGARAIQLRAGHDAIASTGRVLGLLVALLRCLRVVGAM